jgi:hypothetical protein
VADALNLTLNKSFQGTPKKLRFFSAPELNRSRDDSLIGIFGSYYKSNGIRGTSRGHPEGAGSSVYADGDRSI